RASKNQLFGCRRLHEVRFAGENEDHITAKPVCRSPRFGLDVVKASARVRFEADASRERMNETEHHTISLLKQTTTPPTSAARFVASHSPITFASSSASV